MKPRKHCELIKANIHRLKYDDSAMGLIWVHPRKFSLVGVRAGSIDSSGHIQIKIKGTLVFAHQIVWLMFNDDLPDQIDHINRIKTDNRITNLRAANSLINAQNAGMRLDNTSGYPGVTWKNGKWHSRISCNRKRIHLGCFPNKEDAITAYRTAKETYHAKA